MFPVGPRDFSLSVAYMITENDLIVMAATSIEHPEIPLVKGVTRGHLHANLFFFFNYLLFILS